MIRVLLADLGGLEGELVREIFRREADMELVGALTRRTELDRAIERLRPDAIIADLASDSLPHEYVNAMNRSPGLVIITVRDGREAIVYQLRPHAQPVGEVWPERLAQLVRAAVGKRRPPSEMVEE